MAIVITIVILIIIFAIIGGSSKKDHNKETLTKNEQVYSNIINSAPEKARPALLKLKEIYDSNEAPDHKQLSAALGIPEKVLMSDYIGIRDTLADDLQSTWWFAISQRHSLQYAPISSIDKLEAFQTYQININANELLYHRLVAVELYEQKVVKREANYSGTRWQTGTFHSGRMSYSTEVVKDFVIQDVGRLYLTNKRIIFSGKHKNVNRSYNFNDILNFTLYQDGILLGLTNGKLPLIKFQELDNSKAINDPNEIFHANDGINRFVRVISRILNGTTEQNLLAEKV